MPLYDYLCKPCDKTYEILHKRFPTKQDEKKLTCEGCEGPLERLLSAPGIIIKGQTAPPPAPLELPKPDTTTLPSRPYDSRDDFCPSSW